MKRATSRICPVCEKTVCKDADDCRVEWEAQRQRDFDDFVADMEDSKAAKEMARKGA